MSQQEAAAATKTDGETKASAAAETASPARRSGRRPVSYREVKIAEDSGNDEESSNEESSAEDDSKEDGKGQDDESEDEDELPILPKKRKLPAGPVARKKGRSPGSASKQLECEFCQKNFSIQSGLDYHVNKFVCRPELKPVGAPRKGGKRKQSEAKGLKKYKKIRGALADRTCPRCKRVFTSVIGCKYHTGKGVCVQKLSGFIPLDTLPAGALFVTPFGIVEVIRDDQAIPVAPVKEESDEEDNAAAAKDDEKEEQSQTPVTSNDPEEQEKVASSSDAVNAESEKAAAKKKKKKATPSVAHRLALARWKERLQKAHTAVGVLHLMRRKKLAKLYETDGHLNQNALWKASFGDDPRKISKEKHTRFARLNILGPKDPTAPASSFPDRIVACRWVRDGRDRFFGPEDVQPPLDPPPSHSKESPVPNVFLRRRCLTEIYTVKQKTFNCPSCGHQYLSRLGVQHHMRSKKCATPKESPMVTQARAMEARAMSLLQRAPLPKKEPMAPRTAGQEDDGSEVETTDPVDTFQQTIQIPHKLGEAKTKKQLEAESTEPDPKFVDPRKALAEIEAELKYHTSVLAKKAAPVAPAKKPEHSLEMIRKRKEKRELEARIQAARAEAAAKEAVAREKAAREKAAREKSATVQQLRQELMKKLERREKQKLEAREERRRRRTYGAINSKEPGKRRHFLEDLHHRLSGRSMIDTRTLVREIDMGRYPSLTREKGLETSTDPKTLQCSVCKSNRGPLANCTFCVRRVHMGCARSKYTLQNPEPMDDFLCNCCIQYIGHRRNRAEKRRLEKIAGAEVTFIPETPKPIPLYRETATGREYESVISQGRHVADLLELEASTRIRLSREMETAQVNEVRRQMMMS